MNRILRMTVRKERFMNRIRSKKDFFIALLKDRYPSATAAIDGIAGHPDASGCVGFYSTPIGVVISAEVSGVSDGEALCPLLLDICDKAGCAPCELLPLSSDGGCARFAALTSRFQIEDVLADGVGELFAHKMSVPS